MCLGYSSAGGTQLIRFRTGQICPAHGKAAICRLRTQAEARKTYHLTTQLAVNNACVSFNDDLLNVCVYVCVGGCVRACVCAFVRACALPCACVCILVCVVSK